MNQRPEDKDYLDAIRRGDIVAVSNALEAGADINAQERFASIGALALALNKHEKDIAYFLLARGGISQESLNEAAHHATRIHDADGLRMVGAFGADMNSVRYGKGILHELAPRSYCRSAKAALDYGASTLKVAQTSYKGSHTGTPQRLFTDLTADNTVLPDMETTQSLLERYGKAETQPFPDRLDRDSLTHSTDGNMALLDQPRFWRHMIRFMDEAAEKATATRATPARRGGRIVSGIKGGITGYIHYQKTRRGAEKLQNIRTDDWEGLDSVLREGLKSGKPLLGKDLLMESNPDGRSWLQRAAECGAFPAVFTYLQQAEGICLTPDDLLEKNGKPNALLAAIQDNYALPALFSLENWAGQGSDALRQLYNALPREARIQVPNYQRLRYELEGLEMARASGVGR